MTQCSVQKPAAASKGGATKQAYAHFGMSSPLLDFMAPMKNANEAAFPRITAAAICRMSVKFIPRSYPTQEGMQ